MRLDERSLHRALLGACGAVGLEIDSAGAGGVTAPEQAREIMGLPRAARVCIIFVDGLGFHQLQARRGHVPAIRGLGTWDFITTVVPSTTAAALSSFATGRLPGETGMVGYSVRLGARRQLTDLITFRNSPVPAHVWQSQPTIFERLGEQARDVILIEDSAYEDSGLTRAAWRGAQAVFATTFPDRVDAALEQLASGKKLVYLYWGNLDHQGHRYGVSSPRWLAELEMIDAEIGRFMRQVPRDTLVILTGDHGMVEDTEKIDVAHEPYLDRDVDAIAGEERAFHLYTSDPQGVARRWQETLGERAWVLTRSQIQDTQLMGALSSRARDAMGDVVAFARERTGIVDSRVLSAGALAMKGVHGSLTPDEMHIPWIVAMS